MSACVRIYINEWHLIQARFLQTTQPQKARKFAWESVHIRLDRSQTPLDRSQFAFERSHFDLRSILLRKKKHKNKQKDE